MVAGATPILLRAATLTGLSLNGALRSRTGIDKDANGIAQELTDQDLYGVSDALVSRLSHGLNLTGNAGSYASTPDHADFDPPTSTLDIRVECAINATTGNRSMIAKHDAAGDQRSWQVAVTPGFGIWSIRSWQDGTASPMRQHTSLFVSSRAFRLLLTPALTTFYIAESFEDAWVERDQFDTNPHLPFFDSSASLDLGARDGGDAERWIGTIFRAELHQDGDLVADPDFRFLPAGTTSFNDTTGKTWTVQGDASVGLAGPTIFP